ncbi:MAG: TRAP transporter small permease subunit [Chromatiales bacterium]|nr:TRAP transporter small permease subunit [Chromatiales bacterium]
MDLVQRVKSGALDITAPSMAASSTLVPAFEMPSAPFLWRDWTEAEAGHPRPGDGCAVQRAPARQAQHPAADRRSGTGAGATSPSPTKRGPQARRHGRVSRSACPEVAGLGRDGPRASARRRRRSRSARCYTALQQKTVDGQENPIPTIYSRKFYEVQGYLTMSPAHAAEQHDRSSTRTQLARSSRPRNAEAPPRRGRGGARPKNTELQQASRSSRCSRTSASPARRRSSTTPIATPSPAKMAAVCPKLEARWGAGPLEDDCIAEIDKRPRQVIRPPIAGFDRQLDVASYRGLAADRRAPRRIAVLVGLGVVMRYVLNDPLTWAEEFVVTLFVWMLIMLGIPAALRSNGCTSASTR